MAASVQVEPKLNDPVARHMRRDFACLHVGQTLEQALAAIRHSPPEGRVIYFYVVDDDNRLQGVVPTRRLLLGALDTRVSEIMVADVIAVPNTATVLDACEFFILHRLLAFPVVDHQRRLMGMVDVELYTQELSDLDQSRRSDELFQLIGVHLTDAQQAWPLTAFGKRFPWLLANIGGGILAAFLSGLYEHELQKVVALALFIPVVLALAESVSVQSVSLALQALHSRAPTGREILRKLRAEATTGLLLGAASSTTVALVALAWLGQARVAVCLLGAITVGMTGAAVIGMAMPNLLRVFRREPRVSSGPIALAAADILTLLVYFSLARSLLG